MSKNLIKKEETLLENISKLNGCIVACSGGVDSLLLATLSHEILQKNCLIAHCVSPAVQADSTERVERFAKENEWNLKIIKTGEFDDENYLKNPSNRCYFCKSHLYESLHAITQEISDPRFKNFPITNGTNVDDLGEYRPGLKAAEEYHVQYPFVQAELTKDDVRQLCRNRNLPYADLQAGACLSSRLYTDTRVTEDRLMAAYAGELFLQKEAGVQLVRCRFKENDMRVEVREHDQPKISATILNQLRQTLLNQHGWIKSIELDEKPYAPGRSFLVKK